MTSRLIAVCFDANDPFGLARFWSGVLGWEILERGAGVAVGLRSGPRDRDPLAARRSEDHVGGPPLMPKTGKYRLHFDLAPPDGGAQQAEVDRLIGLGATRIDIDQGDVSWVVLADPDGHEFCMLTPR